MTTVENIQIALLEADSRQCALGLPIFTRYLYDKPDVKHSMLAALLLRERDEALFWALELYYSGFVSELVEWIQWIYTHYYAEHNPRFGKYISDVLKYKGQTDLVIGSIVSNFAHRTPNMNIGVSPLNLGNPVSESRIYIVLYERDVEAFRREPGANVLPRNYLKEGCRYPIRQAKSEAKSEKDAEYLANWLYYAALETPVWQSRVSAYSSFRLDHPTQTAVFDDDDQLESFYDKYGLEPDEQPLSIHHMRGFFLDKPL